MLAILYPIFGGFYAYFAGAAAHHKGYNGTLFGTIAFVLGAIGVAVFYLVGAGSGDEPVNQAWGIAYSAAFGLLPSIALIFMGSKKKEEGAHAH
ncbi:MAG: hypothetical protein D6729_09835 [Deltaproteobacteria bacterium]|nr:MAG: hypothetical protein D6729_09835 [Deltaproteobacteria bacterium]